MSDERTPAHRGETDSSVSVLAEISREMVRLYKEQFGRGPTRARSDFAGPDTLVCTLEETFTPAEQRLAAMGEHQRVRDTRLYFQHATKAEFCEVVERRLGRAVRAFISGIDMGHDVSAEVFYLESAAGSRAAVGSVPTARSVAPMSLTSPLEARITSAARPADFSSMSIGKLVEARR
jgi:uncharacterized protein YbcI